MLAVGAVAPPFEAQSSDGRTVRLSDYRGKALVLYFFPKAFTPLCAMETRRFRDNYADIAALGADVLGVSTDELEVQCAFGRRQQIQFPLLADPDRRIADAYGVSWPMVARARRVTFVIGESSLIELATWHEFQVSKHLDEVLSHLQKRGRAAARKG